MTPKEFAPTPASVNIVHRREKLPTLLTHVFPYEITHVGGGLARAEELLSSDPPWGLGVVFDHYSLRDFGDIARALATSKVLRERPTLVPMAFHQFHQFRPLVALVSEYLDVAFRPIVIRDTLKRPRFRGMPPGKGLLTYLKDATKILSCGGIVPLSPQEGRRPKLGKPEVPALSTLLTVAGKENDRIAILFVGLGTRGVEDYGGVLVKTVNPFRTVEIKFGATFTMREAQTQATKAGQTLDEWAFNQLEPLVPSAYR